MRRRGPAPSTEVLTRDFGWAVCHLLGGDKVAVLAKRAGLSSKSKGLVSTNIARILALLPEPDVVDREFRRYVVALRAAEAEAALGAGRARNP